MTNLITQPQPTMYFFGVTTSKSSSRKMFPAWAQILDLPEAQLVGVDLPMNAPAEMYRQAVAQIKADPLSLGALVTTHKINVLTAARDLFDNLTPAAALCGEVSCIFKRGDNLIGHAVDPKTSGLSMAQFLPDGYWQRHQAEMMCLGAGGSAVALVVHFATRAEAHNRPNRIVIVNRSQAKLDNLQLLLKKLPTSGIDFELIQNQDPTVNDHIMAQCAPYSMVINATGMGKDTPGSPITDAGYFPQNGIAWELNYRGELDFMHQARKQRASRGVQVEDGWYYFLVGWAEVISFIFDLEISATQFAALSQAAEAIRV